MIEVSVPGCRTWCSVDYAARAFIVSGFQNRERMQIVVHGLEGIDGGVDGEFGFSHCDGEGLEIRCCGENGVDCGGVGCAIPEIEGFEGWEVGWFEPCFAILKGKRRNILVPVMPSRYDESVDRRYLVWHIESL